MISSLPAIRNRTCIDNVAAGAALIMTALGMNFDFDKATLRPESEVVLEQVAPQIALGHPLASQARFASDRHQSRHDVMGQRLPLPFVIATQ